MPNDAQIAYFSMEIGFDPDLMSQNRQEAKDRVRAEHDYRVNLKAELEIRHLHAKLDLLLTHQWQRLLEIQEIQMELMQEAGKARRK